MGRVETDTRAWYVLGSYRISKHLELGSYYSRSGTSWDNYMLFPGVPPYVAASGPADSPDRHVYDKVVTARVDLNSYWNFKIEGHFMDGWRGSMYPNGFYLADNPSGIQRKTNVLIVRTGWAF